VSRYTASCGFGTSSIALADRSCISGLQSVKFCTSVNDSDDAADDDDGENSPHQKKPDEFFSPVTHVHPLKPVVASKQPSRFLPTSLRDRISQHRSTLVPGFYQT